MIKKIESMIDDFAKAYCSYDEVRFYAKIENPNFKLTDVEFDECYINKGMLVLKNAECDGTEGEVVISNIQSFEKTDINFGTLYMIIVGNTKINLSMFLN